MRRGPRYVLTTVCDQRVGDDLCGLTLDVC